MKVAKSHYSVPAQMENDEQQALTGNRMLQCGHLISESYQAEGDGTIFRK